MGIWRRNGLTIVLVVLTVLSIAGMFVSGLFAYQSELGQHGAGGIAASRYAATGHFLSAIFENWESEFLQMGAYVCLTAFLFQKGSAESKDPDGGARENDHTPSGFGPVTGFLYSYSLGIALAALFIISFLLHFHFSWKAENAEALLHGEAPLPYLGHLFDSQFWFESLQNWQSEFLSTAVLVVLSIFLRFRGSPESKPVAAPHSETGA
jgi:hypothetical protein